MAPPEFIGRSDGEGGDVTADVPGSVIEGKGYADGTPHQLAISQDERNTIKYAKENCDKVVVIIDSSNVIEIGDLMNDDSDVSADAILWIGGPGGQGFKAMSKILCGDVNPSGKTVDAWNDRYHGRPQHVELRQRRIREPVSVAGRLSESGWRFHRNELHRV